MFLFCVTVDLYRYGAYGIVVVFPISLVCNVPGVDDNLTVLPVIPALAYLPPIVS